MMLDEETLAGYADGEAENANEIRAALASRPQLAQRVAELRAQRERIADAYAPVLEEPVPARLRALVNAPVAVAASRARQATIGIAAFAAVAAAALFALYSHPPSRAPIAPSSVAIDDRPAIIRPKAPNYVYLVHDYNSPIWLNKPAGIAFAKYYPKRALAVDMGGRVVLGCVAGADGYLTCAVEREEPDGWGFGDAALTISREFRIAPREPDGRSTVGERIRLPITFRTSGPPVITNPTWLQRPTRRDFMRVYPAEALKRELGGRAVLSCTVAKDGRLACTVKSEEPPGLGFGEAALKMSKLFQMAPKTVDGVATSGGRVTIPITFKLGD